MKDLECDFSFESQKFRENIDVEQSRCVKKFWDLNIYVIYTYVIYITYRCSLNS